MYTVEEIKGQGNKRAVVAYEDYSIESPREWDNVGTMICWHRRYKLGDEHKYNSPSEAIADLWQDHASEDEKRDLALKLLRGMDREKVRDYVGEARRVHPYLSREGRRGVVYKYILEDYFSDCPEDLELPPSIYYLPLYLYDHGGITMSTGGFSCPFDSGQVGFIYCTEEKAKKEGIDTANVERILKGEVNTYDQYLRGEVYQVIAYDGDEITDSVTGYYSLEDAISEAKSMIGG